MNEIIDVCYKCGGVGWLSVDSSREMEQSSIECGLNCGVIMHGKMCEEDLVKKYNRELEDLLPDAFEKLEDQLSHTQARLEEAVINAFMAGQADCGVDPSYSSAKAYFLTNQNTEE